MPQPETQPITEISPENVKAMLNLLGKTVSELISTQPEPQWLAFLQQSQNLAYIPYQQSVEKQIDQAMAKIDIQPDLDYIAGQIKWLIEGHHYLIKRMWRGTPSEGDEITLGDSITEAGYQGLKTDGSLVIGNHVGCEHDANITFRLENHEHGGMNIMLDAQIDPSDPNRVKAMNLLLLGDTPDGHYWQKIWLAGDWKKNEGYFDFHDQIKYKAKAIA